jgi:hypothetical protein
VRKRPNLSDLLPPLLQEFAIKLTTLSRHININTSGQVVVLEEIVIAK